jgi:hypothetical protein
MTTPEGVKKSSARTADEIAEPAEPRTLAEAHHAVARIRPRQKAPLTEWLAYHQRSAAWYAEVAEIDRAHHHETLFMAEQQRQHAMEIKDQILSQQPVGEV